MDRSGLNSLNDTSGLCLQDLVGGGQTNGNLNNNNNSNSNSNNHPNNSMDHIHNHHHHHHQGLHDNISVSTSSAISNLMSPTNLGALGPSLASGLGHLHHTGHTDLSTHHHHHHITASHTPSVLHEPLEKLKRKSFFYFCWLSNILFIR
jgi:hypothetical protein